jgi:hypothetical protein
MIYCTKIEPVVEGKDDQMKQEIEELTQNVCQLKEQQVMLQKRIQYLPRAQSHQIYSIRGRIGSSDSHIGIIQPRTTVTNRLE